MARHEEDYRRVVGTVSFTRLLPGSQVEIIGHFNGCTPPRYAIFDFDGTLSLIREGWPEVMAPMMVEVLQATGTSESAEALGRLAKEFIMQLNGKQTIYQMIRLAEEVGKRGGIPEDPLVYKQRYHNRLMRRVAGRRDALREGRIPPDEMLVPGTFAMLDELRRRGVELYLASGTDEQYVVEEVELLRLTDYFGGRVYGARDDYRSFSKAQVIRRILIENQVDGAALVGFGDGYVEIADVKEAGGIAVAVASDEAGRSGRPDPWKRDRLIGVGADVVIPDFQDWRPLVDYLWSAGEEAC